MVETLNEISLSSYDQVIVSMQDINYFKIKNSFRRLHIINASAPDTSTVCNRISSIFIRENKKSAKRILSLSRTYNLTSVVIVMSYPGDSVLKKLSKFGMQLTYVIHDLSRHPGDFWPNKKAINQMLKADRLIALSKYVFYQLDHPDKYLSSLSRRGDTVVTLKVHDIPASYFLIIGRLKKYKNLKLVAKAIDCFPEINFICAGIGSQKFSEKKNVTTIDRWLLDEEMEYLIKNSRGLIAIYSEASQSGIVDQALYWKRPILISDKGALLEQIGTTGAGVLCDTDTLLNVVNGISNLITFDSETIQRQVISKTLFDTLKSF